MSSVTAAAGPVPAGDAGTSGAAAAARLVVIRPTLQVQGADLRQGVAGDRLFSPPAGVQVTYSAVLADGRPLPSWLRIDAQTGRLQGVPPAGESVLEVQVVAQTADGQSASARIRLNRD